MIKQFRNKIKKWLNINTVKFNNKLIDIYYISELSLTNQVITVKINIGDINTNNKFKINNNLLVVKNLVI